MNFIRAHQAKSFPRLLHFGRCGVAMGLLLFAPAPALPQSDCAELLQQAQNKFNTVEFEEAQALVMNCLEAGAASKHDSLEAHFTLAAIAFQQGDTTLSTRYVNAVLQLDCDYEPEWKATTPFSAFYDGIKKQVRCDTAADTSTAFTPLIRPETGVLGWLAVNLGGGTNFGKEEYAKNPLLLHARFGFEFAELEFRTVEIINRLSERYPNQVKTEIPTLAFKISLLEGSLRRGWPGFTTVFRTDVGIWDFDSDDLKADSLIYRRDSDEFLLFFSKTLGPVQLHAGGSYSFLQARLDSTNADSAYKTMEWNGLNFFGTLQVQATSLAMLMITFEPIAEFKDYKNGLQAPATQGLLSIDVLAFLLPKSPALAVNLGVNWRVRLTKLNPEEIAPEDDDRFRIKLGATLGFSLTKSFTELNKP